MKINDIIKFRRKELNLTLEDISKACDVSVSTVSRWESGDIGDIKRSRIKELCKILKLSPAVIVGVAEEEQICDKLGIDYIKIPLYSYVSCGTGLFVDDMVEDYIAVPYRLINPHSDYFAHVASGDSMIGKGIKDGDVLVFEKTNYLESGQVGSFCIGESQAVCKIFRKLPNGMIMLESANDKYEPILVDIYDECFRVIGKYKFKFSVEQ